ARGKDGNPIKDARFTVKVIGPNKDVTDVQPVKEGDILRGSYWKTKEPGEYEIQVSAVARDESGKEKSLGSARARFIGYSEDLENLRPAADPGFLAKLASAGGGKAFKAGVPEMLEFLKELREKPAQEGRARGDRWPDWQRTPSSDTIADQITALSSSG